MPKKPFEEQDPWENTEIEEFDELDRDGIANYLGKKGGVELLIEIGEGGVQYSELEEKLPISRSTFYHRIGEATDLHLVGTKSAQVENSVKDFYVLTPAGRAIFEYMNEIQLHKVYWKLQERRTQFNELTDSVEEWVEDDESEFDQAFAGLAHSENRDEPYVRTHKE